ncbi:MAG: MarR family winged helix-turn-helix transcriptional regulator [Thermoflexaceae bacterium]|nr:MarR family winged helix-turn-helix transcriptional regulator [Thermoflexaceae bacterium]
MEHSVEGILRGGKFKKLLENIMTDAKKRTNLNRVEIEVLYFLHRYGEQNTLTDICQYLQMNKGHISSTMDNLCDKGYVVYKRDDRDRRYVHYEITQQADSIIRDMDNAWKKMSERILSGIGREDLQTFNRVAKQIEDNIEMML